jgi:hypothetical protein
MILLKAVADDLVDEALLERAPAFEGRFLAMILAPNPKYVKESAEAEQQSDEAEKQLDHAKA